MIEENQFDTILQECGSAKQRWLVGILHATCSRVGRLQSRDLTVGMGSEKGKLSFVS